MSKIDALQKSNLNLLKTSCKISQLILDFKWEESQLGVPNSWSVSLLNTLGLLLRSEVPMFLVWGDHYIQFYNDAYEREIFDHSEFKFYLGYSVNTKAPNFWPIIYPSIVDVFENDKNDTLHISASAYGSQTNFVFNFSKVLDFEGEKGGVLVTTFKNPTTNFSKVDITKVINQLIENETRYKYILADAPVPLCILHGKDLILEAVNQKMLDVIKRDKRDILERKMRDYMPEFTNQGLTPLIEQVYCTGIAVERKEERLIVYDNQNVPHEVYTAYVFHPLKNDFGETTHVLVMGNIINDQVSARKKAEKAEEIMRMSVEAANVGTWTMDINTGEIIGSERLNELLGFKSSAPFSIYKLANFVQEDKVKIIEKEIKNTIKNGGKFFIEIEIFVPPKYPERWIKVLGEIYKDSFTGEKQFSGLVMDITDQKIKDRRKNDFIGMVSHELKTPITSLNGYLQLLNLKIKDNDLSFQANIIEKSINQISKMKTLINGFLSVSRLESGKFMIYKTYFNLIDLVDEVIQELNFQINKHFIVKNYSGEIIVNADYDKIFSVMSNLILNAVKYSKIATKIEISITIEKKWVFVQVKDYGFGIDKFEVDNLFTRYYRSENNVSKNISGFGIGLYLTSEIIHSHNGKIWVVSELNKGSEFSFKIPLT